MDKKKFKIDFLCVGFNKCGTTTLERALKNNEDIYLPENKKETLFFAWYKNYEDPVLELQKKYYPDYYKYKCVGSIEPSYCKKAEDIYKYFGKDVKLIFMMRNPIKASFSLFKMRLRRTPDEYFVKLYKTCKNNFNTMFEKYIDDYILTKKNGDFFYDEWLEEYLKYFKKEQMKFIIFEEFIKNPETILKEIYEFLDVSNRNLKGPLKKSNKGDKITRNYYCAKFNHFLYEKLHKQRMDQANNENSYYYKKLFNYFYRFTLKKINYSITEKSNKRLMNIYLPSIKNLEKIIGMNLGEGLWYLEMNEKNEYIKAIEKLNEEYMKLYNSPALKKERRNKRILINIRHFKFKQLFLDFFSKLKRNDKVSKVGFLESVISKKREGKRIVYTCIAGKYDNLLSPLITTPNTDYVVFSDNKNIADNTEHWVYKSIPEYIIKKCHNNSILINRYIKFHPHELFEDYDLSLYVDGSIKIISDIAECFYYIKDKTGFAMHDHRTRNDVYEEAKACIKIKRGNVKAIKKLIEKYEKENFPHDTGLLEATIIATDLHSSKSKEILSEWYDEFIKAKTMRDQLSLPYVLWKKGLKCSDVGILSSNIINNPKFRWYEHPSKYSSHKILAFKKIRKRMANYGFKYRCNVCHSHLKLLNEGDICPICKTNSLQRLLYFYLKKNIKNKQKNSILWIDPCSVIKYKLQKNKNIYFKDITLNDYKSEQNKDKFDFIVIESNNEYDKKFIDNLENNLKSDGNIFLFDLNKEEISKFEKRRFNIVKIDYSSNKYVQQKTNLFYIINKK